VWDELSRSFLFLKRPSWDLKEVIVTSAVRLDFRCWRREGIAHGRYLFSGNVTPWGDRIASALRRAKCVCLTCCFGRHGDHQAPLVGVFVGDGADNNWVLISWACAKPEVRKFGFARLRLKGFLNVLASSNSCTFFRYFETLLKQHVQAGFYLTEAVK